MGAVLALILTISSVSGTTINSPDDVLIVYATASGLQSSTQYLQAAFTKDGDTVNYLGLTKNLADEWYQYKSSPASSDLNSYFYSFTPVSGTWSGQLVAKIDINDDGFKGPGNYLLKLFKYISSYGAASNNSISVAVNVTAPSIASPTAVANLPAPVIEFIVPAAANLGESFKTMANLKNFDGNTEFYLKIRDKVQTKNGSSYLSDNESWTNFPLIKTDNSGNWSGEIWGLMTEDKDDGVYKIKLRAKKKNTDSFFESDSKEIKLIKIIKITSAILPTATPETKLVLGTKSAALKTQPKPEEEKEKFDLTNLGLLAGGLVLSGGSVIIALKFKHGI